VTSGQNCGYSTRKEGDGLAYMASAQSDDCRAASKLAVRNAARLRFLNDLIIQAPKRALDGCKDIFAGCLLGWRKQRGLPATAHY